MAAVSLNSIDIKVDRRHDMKRIALAGLAILLVNGHIWAVTGAEVSRKTGLAGGLCCFPRIAQLDEPLALELARRPSFIVYAASQDASAVAHVRDSAAAEGLLGRSLYVETAGAALPLAAR